MIDPSIPDGGVRAKFGGNVAIYFPGILSFKICWCWRAWLFHICFEVSINDLELVLLMMKLHSGSCFGHGYSHCLVVLAIAIMFIHGSFTMKSLQAVHAEMLLVLVLAITAHEQSTQVLNCSVMLAPFLSYEKQIGCLAVIITLGLMTNVERFS